MNAIVKTTEFSPIVVSDLKPGTMYIISIETISTSGSRSTSSDELRAVTGKLSSCHKD